MEGLLCVFFFFACDVCGAFWVSDEGHDAGDDGGDGDLSQDGLSHVVFNKSIVFIL